MIISIFLVLLISLISKSTYAQINTATPSPTLSTTSAQENKVIQTLKEKLATKVAELREKNVKAISGAIIELKEGTSLTGIKIRDWKNETYEIKIDADLTKFFQISGVAKKEIKASLLEKDDYIVVTGIIKDKLIDANFVYLDELFIIGSGKVTEVNKEDFFISVITSDKENYTLDVEKSTKQQLLNIKTLVPESVGFSKIKVGDSIHFVVKKTAANAADAGNEKEENRYPAEKILTIPQEYFTK